MVGWWYRNATAFYLPQGWFGPLGGGSILRVYSFQVSALVISGGKLGNVTGKELEM